MLLVSAATWILPRMFPLDSPRSTPELDSGTGTVRNCTRNTNVLLLCSPPHRYMQGSFDYENLICNLGGFFD